MELGKSLYLRHKKTGQRFRQPVFIHQPSAILHVFFGTIIAVIMLKRQE